MKPIKQAELFKKFRPYIPDEYKTHPIYCAPSDAAVYQVKSDKALARKFKHQGSLQQTGTKRLWKSKKRPFKKRKISFSKNVQEFETLWQDVYRSWDLIGASDFANRHPRFQSPWRVPRSVIYFPPSVQQQLEACLRSGRHLTVHRSSRTRALVEGKEVDLDVASCGCKTYSQTGLPCKHMTAVSLFFRNAVKDFVHKSYASTIPPISTKDLEPDGTTLPSPIKALLKHRSIIKWPKRTQRELSSAYHDETYGLPGCVGFVDGTHFILEQRPAVDGETYFTRKCRYALNAQIICNEQYRLIFVSLG